MKTKSTTETTRTQVENENKVALENALTLAGWTFEEEETDSDFWTTFSTDCPEETLDLFMNEL